MDRDKLSKITGKFRRSIIQLIDQTGLRFLSRWNWRTIFTIPLTTFPVRIKLLNHRIPLVIALLKRTVGKAKPRRSFQCNLIESCLPTICLQAFSLS